jgi:hypothetical protein
MTLKGSITAACGHVLADDEGCGIPVIYQGESIDHYVGFVPALIYSTFCRACEAEWRSKGLLFKDEAEAEDWLDAQPLPEPKLR